MPDPTLEELLLRKATSIGANQYPPVQEQGIPVGPGGVKQLLELGGLAPKIWGQWEMSKDPMKVLLEQLPKVWKQSLGGYSAGKLWHGMGNIPGLKQQWPFSLLPGSNPPEEIK